MIPLFSENLKRFFVCEEKAFSEEEESLCGQSNTCVGVYGPTCAQSHYDERLTRAEMPDRNSRLWPR
jgi:hypothetical protein